jgi:hypothetical protein
MQVVKRLAKIAAIVLTSWLVAAVALIWAGIIPGSGIFTLLDGIIGFQSASTAQPIEAPIAQRPPLPPEAQRLVDEADRAVAARRFADAAEHYVAASRHTDEHPELLFSASRSYRFAGVPWRAAAYMLAYVESAKLSYDVHLFLLDEVDELAAGAGALARELFATAVEAGARLPLDKRSSAQSEVVQQIVLAGDIEALQLIARRAPEGLPEGAGAAAEGLAQAGRWQLARAALDVAIESVPAAARRSAPDKCRKILHAVPACAMEVLHPGFAGLPPVLSDARCPPPPPPPDMRPREQNLEGLMLMGLAISEYQVGLKGRAHGHWLDGRALLKSSRLEQLCDQPWHRDYTAMQVGGDWVFLSPEGKHVGVPSGEDVEQTDREPPPVRWAEVMALLNRAPTRDDETQRMVELLDRRDLDNPGAAIEEANSSKNIEMKPFLIARLGRYYFRLYSALQASAGALRR